MSRLPINFVYRDLMRVADDHDTRLVLSLVKPIVPTTHVPDIDAVNDPIVLGEYIDQAERWHRIRIIRNQGYYVIDDVYKTECNKMTAKQRAVVILDVQAQFMASDKGYKLMGDIQHRDQQIAAEVECYRASGLAKGFPLSVAQRLVARGAIESSGGLIQKTVRKMHARYFA